MKKVFIACVASDKAYANKISSELNSLDVSNSIGVLDSDSPSVLGEIAEGITACDIFLLIISCDTHDSPMVNNAITYAFNKKQRDAILPYIVESSGMTPALEFVFAGINWRTSDTMPIPELSKEIASRLGMAPEDIDYLGKGIRYYKAGEMANAIEMFKKGVEHGSAASAFNLGIIFFAGNGVIKDDAKACRWFEKAASMGHTGGMRKMACCCYTGTGTAVDKPASVRWLKRVVESLNEDTTEDVIWACRTLSIQYTKGDGVSPDPKEAAYWENMADELSKL